MRVLDVLMPQANEKNEWTTRYIPSTSQRKSQAWKRRRENRFFDYGFLQKSQQVLDVCLARIAVQHQCISEQLSWKSNRLISDRSKVQSLPLIPEASVMISIPNSQREVSKSGSKHLRAIFSALPLRSQARILKVKLLPILTHKTIDVASGYEVCSLRLMTCLNK